MRVQFLNFERGPGVPLLNFEVVPGVPLLNIRGSRVPLLHYAQTYRRIIGVNDK